MTNTAVWTLPFGLLGAVIGSFLNVVIYRLPRGLSVASPRWSFCPGCNERIAARDNIPVLGWLALGGRCRRCATFIPFFYPLVECVTILTFIALWDVLFISKMSPLPGTLPDDLPALIAYASLFAGLIAGAGIDIESYTIDIRVPLLTTLIAILCYGYRGLPNLIPDATPTLPPTLVGLPILGGLVWLITRPLFARKETPIPIHDATPSSPSPEPQTFSPDATAGAPAPEAVSAPVQESPGRQATARWPIIVMVLITVALTAWMILWRDEPSNWQISAGGVRGFIFTGLFLLVLILASMVHRPGDVQIMTDLEQERFAARPTALREFAEFLPALLICTATFYYLRKTDRMNSSWADVLPVGAMRFWLAHLYGASAAIAGAILASTIGWTVRILGTLAFGKEAFGTGDIYLLAAIGAAGGLGFTVYAFFMAALLALVGVVATSFKKSSRAIPFGPWLGLGAFSAMWLEEPLNRFFAPAMSLVWSALCGRPLSLSGG